MSVFSSIRFKVILPVILVFLVGMANFAYLLLWWQRNAFRETALNQVETTSQIVMSTLEDEMLVGKGWAVQHHIEDFKRVDDLRLLWVVDNNGRVAYARHREDVGRDALDEIGEDMNPDQPVKTMLGKEIRMVSAIPNLQECQRCHGSESSTVGYLVTSVGMDELVRTASVGRNYIIGIALITFVVVCSVILMLLSHNVTKPLGELEMAMHRVEEDNLVVDIAHKGDDELGRLGKSLESMVKRLREAKREIESLHTAQMLKVEKLATLGQVAAGLAHEIKNPIAGIKGAVQVIASEPGHSESEKEVYDEMLIQLSRMEKTVRDLLSFARPSPPSRKPTDLNHLVSDVVSFVRRQGDTSVVTVKESLAKDLPMTHLDPDQVHQALLNIALNAVQAMPTGGTLTFSTWNRNGDLGVTVSDTGPGIDRERQDKIFEPFYTTKHKGTGLGLSIVKNIVEANGGDIRVFSDIGKGASFEIFFKGEEPE